jgi:hypothetical protein
MKRSYAVAWSSDAERGAGRLELFADRFELHGRELPLEVLFAEVMSASIARRPADRLLGLPVLALGLRDGVTLRIACLEGAGFVQELADRVERAGRPVLVA